MRLGIIGLPNSGKTTVFNALTGSQRPTEPVTSGQFEVHTVITNVPDSRVDVLSDMYKPRKTIYATVTFSDFGGLDKGFSEKGISGQVKTEMSQVDGFVHVVRAFEDDSVPHPHLTVDPVRDLEMMDTEFILSDLLTVEARLERLEGDLRRAKKADQDKVSAEITLMERLKADLEAEIPLRDVELTSDEEKDLRGFGFFSRKPVLVVLNLGDENAPPDLRYDHKDAEILAIRGKIEAEIAQLSAEDAEIFLEEYNIKEPGSNLVIRTSYKLLSMQSFFTVGEDEVRAWTVPVGATAPEAAGVIHTDLQKGFIRAEVMVYAALVELGSEEAVKAAGKMRLEGKTYVMQDGDIVRIRSGK